jgi:lipoyl(octanoyl) transferase
MQIFFLDRIDFDTAFQLQQRLIAEVAQREDGQIQLLLCEHPPIITIGRGGSPGEVATQSGALRSREIEVRWVNRGGGCLLHCPGQLAIYPIIPLRQCHWLVGEFLERFHVGLLNTLGELNVHGRILPNRHGIWGRTGQLVGIGAAVRHWTTYLGAYLNVCPPLGLFRLVESDPIDHSSMSSLAAERCGPAKMTSVRAALVQNLPAALGCDQYALHTGHPLLRRKAYCDSSE